MPSILQDDSLGVRRDQLRLIRQRLAQRLLSSDREHGIVGFVCVLGKGIDFSRAASALGKGTDLSVPSRKRFVFRALAPEVSSHTGNVAQQSPLSP